MTMRKPEVCRGAKLRVDSVERGAVLKWESREAKSSPCGAIPKAL